MEEKGTRLIVLAQRAELEFSLEFSVANWTWIEFFLSFYISEFSQRRKTSLVASAECKLVWYAALLKLFWVDRKSSKELHSLQFISSSTIWSNLFHKSSRSLALNCEKRKRRLQKKERIEHSGLISGKSKRSFGVAIFIKGRRVVGSCQ